MEHIADKVTVTDVLVVGGGLADKNGDGKVSMEEAMDYAYDGVMSQIPPEPQEPCISDMYLTYSNCVGS